MFSRLKDMGMTYKEVNPVVDPEAAKYLLGEMVSSAGVTMIYHSWATQAIMDGDVIKGAFIESKSGRQAVLAKVVIDCTGDGDVFNWAGEDFYEIKYDIGLVHRLGNIDRIDPTRPGFKEKTAHVIGKPTPLKSVNWVNMVGEHDQSALDVKNLSRLQAKYRKKIWEQTEELRKSPGYEDVFLLETAPQLGVRASRILKGMYTLTFEESMTYASFDDAIGVSGAWISVPFRGKKVSPQQRPCWQIPYRALVPKKTQNLLVAGRCFSHERALVEDGRVIGTCLVTGQGAGVAAAIAVNDRASVRDVDTAKLRKALLAQNVWMGL